MNKNRCGWFSKAGVLVVLVGITLACSPAPKTPSSAEPTSLPVDRDPFTPYGVEVTDFTSQQETLILQVVQAYAHEVGSIEQFKSLFLSINDGQILRIYYDPEGKGASVNKSMRLSATVFSIARAENAKLNRYEANTEEAHAQIVIGHEVGHLLVHAALIKNGDEWSKTYQERVKRDWKIFNDTRAVEEEAVTELSLKVQNMGYYHSTWIAAKETDPNRIAEIDSWVNDFLTSLKNYDFTGQTIYER